MLITNEVPGTRLYPTDTKVNRKWSLSSRDLQRQSCHLKNRLIDGQQADSSGRWELGVGVGWEVGTNNKENRET